MSKEYLEALESIIEKTGCMNDTCAHLGNCLKDNKCRYIDDNLMCPDYEVANQIKQALQRLEAIEESNSSEALNITKATEKYTGIDLSIVKQALIKSQEQSLKDKAFELIILKNVDVKEIRPNATAKAYNSKMPYYRQSLTDDEFKFLKEMVHRLDCEEILFELPKVY